MNNQYKDTDKSVEEKYKFKIACINFIWIVAFLLCIIALLLSYKFWGKPEPLENLISIGSGIVSIFLAIVAIIFSVSESIKTNGKENVLEIILGKIQSSVNELQKISSRIEFVINKTKEDIENLNNQFNEMCTQQYENFNDKKFNKEIQENDSCDKLKSLDEAINNNSNKSPLSSACLHERNIRKGEVYLIDDTSKFRPVVVIQNNIANRYMSTVTVVPITSRVFKDNRLPTHVNISINQKESTAIVERITTINKQELKQYMLCLDDNQIKSIHTALKIEFGIDCN